MPSGTMKVSEGMVMAIWCAASGAMPKVPIARVAALNSATSNSMVTPIGSAQMEQFAPASANAAARSDAGCDKRAAPGMPKHDRRHRHQS